MAYALQTDTTNSSPGAILNFVSTVLIFLQACLALWRQVKFGPSWATLTTRKSLQSELPEWASVSLQPEPLPSESPVLTRKTSCPISNETVTPSQMVLVRFLSCLRLTLPNNFTSRLQSRLCFSSGLVDAKVSLLYPTSCQVSTFRFE